MRNIPTYEEFTEGKKLTLKQHAARQKKYNELYGVAETVEDGEPIDRPGRCECGSGRFENRINNRILTRTCKGCGEERIM